eukprot:6432800-Amphidinium_carterae.1
MGRARCGESGLDSGGVYSASGHEGFRDWALSSGHACVGSLTSSRAIRIRIGLTSSSAIRAR